MAHQVFTIDSPLTARDAFDKLVDLTRVSEWDRGITNPRQLSGDGHVAGSTYEVTVVGFDGVPTPVVYELLEVDRPRRFVMEGATEVFRAHDVIEVEPTGENGCMVTYRAGLELVGDTPPLTPTALDALFVKVAGVAESGLRVYLGT